MTTLTNIWNWLDGKKVNIGAALLVLSTVITQLIIGVNGYDPHWIDVVVKNLNYIGEAFAGTGLIHQQVKIQTAKTEAKMTVEKSATDAKV